MSKEVIGVEASAGAVRQARRNARVNNRSNLRFFEEPVDAALRNTSVRPDIVVLDPPRAGCGGKLAHRIAELHAGRIVYISCNPTTFAPEAAVFLSRGYSLRRLTLVDQFPNTYHIEMVAQFELL